MNSKTLREEWKAETKNNTMEVTRGFDCDVCKADVEIDVWNDNYIFWLEKRISRKLFCMEGETKNEKIFS